MLKNELALNVVSVFRENVDMSDEFCRQGVATKLLEYIMKEIKNGTLDS